MTKKQDDDKTEETEAETKAIPVDSDEREGNDVHALIGSGAPTIKIRANAHILGLAPGEEGSFVQTEEIRILIQQEYATKVSEDE